MANAPSQDAAAERARVLVEGMGANILAIQDSDGAWRKPGERTWEATLYTLLLLRSTGVDPEDPKVMRAISRLESLRWNDLGGCWDLRPAETGGNLFFDGEEEPCINGGVLALSGYFGHPSTRLAKRLVTEQLEDGGWNCEAPQSRRSSFHSTICVLEGLLEYERAVGNAPEVTAARHKGEEYLLERALFRRLSTGEVASAEFLELAFPPRYHYDVLRALDYFRESGAAPDVRMHDAIRVIAEKRLANGRWELDGSFEEASAVSAGEVVGQPSRWNTLRALRVLSWFGNAA